MIEKKRSANVPLQLEIRTPISLWAVILMLFFLGCASAPNPVYEGPYPDGFSLLAEKNPSLAREFGRLPELQDGLTFGEEKALKHLTEIYLKNPESFDRTFAKMNLIGLLQYRRYCTPLQALFWLSEKGEFDTVESTLGDFSLTRLLISA